MNELLEPLRHTLQTMPYELLMLITIATTGAFLLALRTMRRMAALDEEEEQIRYARLMSELADEGGCAPLSDEQREHLNQLR